ncbi:hypothetical protein HPP92_016727 [Vanilla planifolia]|uniref:Uncharacterized protein n=1 Tax=Vanilla planifolia TaxID=51239 RepID=A0A835QJE8_VANPL|nr:hypothetical protein HPP92_016727 [Vanilla planifolia]
MLSPTQPSFYSTWLHDMHYINALPPFHPTFLVLCIYIDSTLSHGRSNLPTRSPLLFMACVNMFNDHQGFCGAPSPMSPRISFSNDFAMDMPPPPRSAAPSDPNFEFAVGGRPMIAADELFFKGRMLPLRDPHPPPAMARATTLRDELRDSEHEEWARPPKGSLRWKEFLGFRRAHGGPSSRKTDKGGCSIASSGVANQEMNQ